MNNDEIDKIKQYYSITNEEFEEIYLYAQKITFKKIIYQRQVNQLQFLQVDNLELEKEII